MPSTACLEEVGGIEPPSRRFPRGDLQPVETITPPKGGERIKPNSVGICYNIPPPHCPILALRCVSYKCKEEKGCKGVPRYTPRYNFVEITHCLLVYDA